MTVFSDLIGQTVTKIEMNEDFLVFTTTEGTHTYTVYGDCCSQSVFFDFYGVENLLSYGEITNAESIRLSPGDPGYRPETWEAGVTNNEDDYDVTQVYGFRFTVIHPIFGEVSAVVSFRNISNGYYGGWVEKWDGISSVVGLEELTEDKIG